MTEKTFVKRLENIFVNDGFFVKKEIGVGYGIADLVMIKKDKINVKNCLRRLSYKQRVPLKDDAYFKTLSYLPEVSDNNKKIDVDCLVNKTKLSKSLLKYKILKYLEEQNYIKCRAGNFYFKINGWLPLANEIIAIESKMKNWKQGAIQANRYKSFANRVYLAVPSSIEHLIDKELFIKHNIGLILLNSSLNDAKIKIQAKKEKALNENKKNCAIEYFWRDKILTKFIPNLA